MSKSCTNILVKIMCLNKTNIGLKLMEYYSLRVQEMSLNKTNIGLKWVLYIRRMGMYYA